MKFSLIETAIKEFDSNYQRDVDVRTLGNGDLELILVTENKATIVNVDKQGVLFRNDYNSTDHSALFSPTIDTADYIRFSMAVRRKSRT